VIPFTPKYYEQKYEGNMEGWVTVTWLGQCSDIGYGLDEQGIIVRFPVRSELFLFSTASRPILEHTQSLSPGVQRTGHESDHSPPYSAKVKNA
jgi:hypothetical protein